MGNRKMGVKVTKELKSMFLNTIMKNHGIIGHTLVECGITRYYYDIWYNTDPAFKEECDKIPSKTLDFVENKLLNLIDDGDKTAIIFYLKCKAKDRGYIEVQRIEQETSFKQPLTINIIPPQIETTTPEQLENKEQKKLNE